LAVKTDFSLWDIRFKVFVSGAVIMALELMGSRLLAPTFGDSIFVWGSLIGVVMTALSLGYYLGGHWADREPNYRNFSLILFTAGILIVLIPLSTPTILELVFVSGLGDMYGPILASLLILAAPTILLGMISPYSLRLSTEDIVSLGGISGSLSSINTIGSIFGTFFTVFFLIPLFGVREIILSLGIFLVIVSMIGLPWSERLFAIIVISIFIIPQSLLGGAIASHGGNILYSGESSYSSIRIVQSSETVTMYLNNMPHSAMYLNGSNNAVFRYTDYFNMAFSFNPDIEKVLFIGGGGFSGPKQFLEYYPNLEIDVVEIDPKVIELAKQYFRLDTNLSRLDIFNEDGRMFLKHGDKYDLIILDAYSKTYVPFHLMTLEFFQQLNEHLNPDGVIVSNMISSLIGDTSDLLYSEVKTVEEIFPNTYLFATKTGIKSIVQNVIMVATKNNQTFNSYKLKQRAQELEMLPSRIQDYTNTLVTSEIQNRNSFVLTDNYAPAETLLNPVTQAPYDREGDLETTHIVNPLILAGAWIGALFSLYLMSNKIRKISGI
jgi:spermidine synthase